MNMLIGFLASSTGRLVRGGLGAALIVIALLAVGGILAWIIAAIGAVLLAAGVFDFCVLAPLVGLPFSGPALRRILTSPRAGRT